MLVVTFMQNSLLVHEPFLFGGGTAHPSLDLLLITFFSVSVAYGFLFSLPEGLGVPVSPDSPWPPLRALHDWAIAEEPAHLDPPRAADHFDLMHWKTLLRRPSCSCVTGIGELATGRWAESATISATPLTTRGKAFL